MLAVVVVVVVMLMRRGRFVRSSFLVAYLGMFSLFINKLKCPN